MASGKILVAITLVTLGTHPALADGLRNGLPPTSMDSFVYEAGSKAEAIYGDESIPIGNGTYSLPPGVSPTPIVGFQKDDRIDAGIMGTRAASLTTGHGSYMPDAAGRDEFLNGGPEFSFSGNTAPVVPQLPGSSFYNQQLPPNSDPGAVSYVPWLPYVDPGATDPRDIIWRISNGLGANPVISAPLMPFPTQGSGF